MSVQIDPHLSMVRPVSPRTPNGCEECLILRSEWVHLRLCLTCGHVGCCDSSPLRHARAHAFARRATNVGRIWHLPARGPQLRPAGGDGGGRAQPLLASVRVWAGAGSASWSATAVRGRARDSAALARNAAAA
jgi:ubiquitin-hydrolase Zn-finger-containing protein